jgi:hypothetical protein
VQTQEMLRGQVLRACTRILISPQQSQYPTRALEMEETNAALGTAEVEVTFLPAGRGGRPTQVLGEDLAGRVPHDEHRAEVADEGSEHVPLLPVPVNGTVRRLSGPGGRGGRAFLERAVQPHESVEVEPFFDSEVRHRGGGIIRAGHGTRRNAGVEPSPPLTSGARQPPARVGPVLSAVAELLKRKLPTNRDRPAFLPDQCPIADTLSVK